MTEREKSIEQLKSIIIERNNIPAKIISNVRKGYEKNLCEYFGFSHKNGIYFDSIFLSLFLELKKQQGQQWLDLFKIADIYFKEELQDIINIFFYYDKKNYIIKNIYLIENRSFLPYYNIDKEKAQKLKNLNIIFPKGQLKTSFSEKIAKDISFWRLK